MAGSLDLDLFQLEDLDPELSKSRKTSHATVFSELFNMPFRGLRCICLLDLNL